MRGDPLADVVSDHPEKLIYPEPIRDLPASIAGTRQRFDPSHAHRLFRTTETIDLSQYCSARPLLPVLKDDRLHLVSAFASACLRLPPDAWLARRLVHPGALQLPDRVS